MMRVMVIVKSGPEVEDGRQPSEQDFAAMGAFNEELVKAGVMLAADGLKPSSQGKRVRFSGKDRTVIDGPFAEAKELIAGYWVWQVKSMEEAIEWVKRCPNPMPSDSEIEIRPIWDMEELSADFTPEFHERHDRLVTQMAEQQKH